MKIHFCCCWVIELFRYESSLQIIQSHLLHLQQQAVAAAAAAASSSLASSSTAHSSTIPQMLQRSSFSAHTETQAHATRTPLSPSDHIHNNGHKDDQQVRATAFELPQRQFPQGSSTPIELLRSPGYRRSSEVSQASEFGSLSLLQQQQHHKQHQSFSQDDSRTGVSTPASQQQLTFESFMRAAAVAAAGLRPSHLSKPSLKHHE